MYPIIKKEIEIQKYAQLCGQYEAVIRKYHSKKDSKNRIWFWADQPNSADYIYVWDPKDTKSQGFGGAKITFTLTDNTEIETKGSWHSNSQALFDCCDIDLRNNCYTLVIIALNRKYKDNKDFLVDILYEDKNWVLSDYHRGDSIAKKFANDLQIPVVCYNQGISGSSNGFVYPDYKSYTDFKDYFESLKED